MKRTAEGAVLACRCAESHQQLLAYDDSASPLLPTVLLPLLCSEALVVPLRAIVTVPELQLSSSWVDFGTCFVNQQTSREIYLMNLSSCRSYWAVLMGHQSAIKEAKDFVVSPSSGLLEARPTNAPPTSITLEVFFTPRSNELYESTMVVEGMLGEKSCALRLRGQGSYDETFMETHQL
ncbi:Hypothetical predicted protein [Marmota monax]|uniref:Deleted in lung and esophageal cancer protein 1 n=1 Tax=Marmota monax TaxID=9995 RepID=A0A5E4CN53_MARMO|nr:hypothetical protein GHT09_018470 [Marmota monax]VTJ82401.1 Hypothetical predicted protein [Marmota monax]